MPHKKDHPPNEAAAQVIRNTGLLGAAARALIKGPTRNIQQEPPKKPKPK